LKQEQKIDQSPKRKLEKQTRRKILMLKEFAVKKTKKKHAPE
jgi:hypothetical protein